MHQAIQPVQCGQSVVRYVQLCDVRQRPQVLECSKPVAAQVQDLHGRVPLSQGLSQGGIQDCFILFAFHTVEASAEVTWHTATAGAQQLRLS